MSKNKKIFSILFGVTGLCIFVLAGALLLMLIFGASVSVKYSAIPTTPEPFEAELMDMISHYKKGEISEIDISIITNFSWDRLYFFGDYTDSESMDKEIGKSWRNTCPEKAAKLKSSDSYTLLVFTNNDVVVDCYIHPKGKHPFDLLPQQYGKPGFSRQEAHFILDDEDYLVLVNSK